MSVRVDESLRLDGDADGLLIDVYKQLITGWNTQDERRFVAPFADDAVLIGFDGSKEIGRTNIAREMRAIFGDHTTARYLAKVKDVRALAEDVRLLVAIVGMIPPGKTDLDPDRHAHQTLVVTRRNDEWRIALFQNTPAQFHGRPELVERLTQELRGVAEKEPETR